MLLTMSSYNNADIDIIFGDFTTEECNQNYNNSSSVKYEKDKEIRDRGINQQTETFIIFGDFTPEECYRIQNQHHHRLSLLSSSSSSVIKDNSAPFVYYNLSCLRCGYNSHTIERCVARRNIYGERIGWATPPRRHIPRQTLPSSPTHNGTVYYNQQIPLNNWCEADKTDYTQFVFSEEEVQEWIEEETETNHHQFENEIHYSSEPNLDYILGYNQALTDYMLYSLGPTF